MLVIKLDLILNLFLIARFIDLQFDSIQSLSNLI